MATSKLYEALVRAAKNGDVRRALAEALLTVIFVAVRSVGSRDDVRD
jgi:hypothetical protein